MTGEVYGLEHWHAAVARRWERAWGDDSDPTPLIFVRSAGGPGTWVVVEPDRGIQSTYFANRYHAVRHALALRRLHGWPIAPVMTEGAA